MKNIHIFKTGTHTDSGGTTLDFDESNLTAAASGYDPQLHEAPIVVGHPKSNGPAYGWIKQLSFNEGGVFAEPHQLNADFEEMVASGAFKKVSASWYLPDSPANPKPGTLYLRHVGFLGAQPPAIKGLSPVEFNEADQGVIEFEDSIEDGWTFQGIGQGFKRLREFIIDKFSREDADTVLPDYLVDDLMRAGERKIEAAQTTPSFEENEVELEELKQKLDDATAANEQLTADNDALKGKVAQFEEQEAANQKAAIETKVDAAIKDGRALPAERDSLIAFAEQAEQTGQTLEFGEGEDKQTLKGADAFLALACSQKKVDFQERSGDDGRQAKEMTAQELSAKAVAYQEEQRELGTTITTAQAVNHILTQNAAE